MATAEDIFSIMLTNDIRIDPKTLDPLEPLSEQGLDSLDIMSILLAIEERFGIKISEEDIDQGKLSSIKGIISYINKAE
jgi:acyl carrier protein